MLKPARSALSACKRLIAKLRRSPAPIQPPFTAALNTLSQAPSFVIVQLGAYIGNSDNDPLFNFLTHLPSRQAPSRQAPSHQAILVEPVAAFFSQLQNNYRHVPGVHLENVAISDTPGTAPFYRLGVDPVAHGYPDWLSQLSSLKDERMHSLWEQYEADPAIQAFYLKHRITEEVPCLTFDQLAQKHALNQVDLLQMDVEGYEFEILKTIDFNRWNIRFINYESVLLQNNQLACETLLRDHGYLLASYQKDTFACRPEDAPLLRSIGHSPT